MQSPILRIKEIVDCRERRPRRSAILYMDYIFLSIGNRHPALRSVGDDAPYGGR